MRQFYRWISAIGVLSLPLISLACAGTPEPLIAVEVSPLCMVLQPGGSQHFDATIFENCVDQGINNSAVNWSVLGGDVNGTVDSDGNYQAPDTVPPPTQQVQVIATSKQDDQKMGQASVLLIVGPTPSPNPCDVLPFSSPAATGCQ